MPSFCAVVNCSMRGNRDNVRFFRIPAALENAGEKLNSLSKERRKLWIQALKRGPLTEGQLKYGRVCSRHFIKGSPADLTDRDNPDWVPSQNMGYYNPREGTLTKAERYERLNKRKRKLEEQQQPLEDTPGTSKDVIGNIPIAESIENQTDVAVQTDVTADDMCKLFNDYNECNSRIYKLEQHLKHYEINESAFVNNDSKTCYFTGMPKAQMLFYLFDLVKEYIPTHSNASLSTFQCVMLTFMKLRLNLPFKFLAYQFNIAPSTASRIFYQCVDILYDRFKCFVFWPTREELRKNVPNCFKETFGNRVAVIVDCFEVFIETPSKLSNAAHCWSNYKHHETIKFLVGITPQGTISYISEAWGGRSSDKYIAENCGFLNLILPNDIVIADRGFLIKDSVECLGAHLEIPAFTKGVNQLHPIDIENTRNIATVRIHVERVIGLLRRKYKLLQGPIPMSMVTNIVNDFSYVDKMVTVCSAMVNLCPSLIPLG